MKYPKNIAGCYVLSIDSLTLRPRHLPCSDPDDIKIDVIWFDEGIAKLIFENGYVQFLPTRYVEKSNVYILIYEGIDHCFQVSANLKGIKIDVELKVVVHFNEFENN